MSGVDNEKCSNGRLNKWLIPASGKPVLNVAFWVSKAAVHCPAIERRFCAIGDAVVADDFGDA